ncbi:MAG: hypothetical protein KKA54_09400 [Proteobacteria bacterium]|nr:hypothetical protein [Pseudomonadota bacterium]
MKANENFDSCVMKNLQNYKLSQLISLYEKEQLAHVSGKKIFIACYPKSGSTFLLHALMQCLHQERIKLVAHHETQQLYYPYLLDNFQVSGIEKRHMLATRPNIDLFKQFHIRPSILVRNIFDVIVSSVDYLRPELQWPRQCGTISKEFFRLPFDKKVDYLIAVAVPWFISFYVSWKLAESEFEINWLSFEQVMADKIAGIQKILLYFIVLRLS